VRYGLPKLVSDEFEHRWLAVMKKRRNSRAAGLLCRIAAAHLATGARHPRRKNCLKRILAFLEKCSRTKWQPADLCEVLTFLLLHEHEEQSREDRRIRESGLSSRLLDDLVPKARVAFPDWAFFQYAAGDREFRKGPRDCNRPLARDCFQRALELAEKGDVRGGLDLVKLAKKNLLTLDEFDGIFATGGRVLLDESENDEDDERPGDLDDDLDEDGGPETLPVGDMSGNLLEQFVQVCRKLGLDPEEVLDRAAQGMPFRLPGMGASFGPRKRD
jgi:hypothetical protein